MNKKYIVDLTTDERTNLESRLSGGEMGVRKVKRIQILLKADDGWTDERIAEALSVVCWLPRNKKKLTRAGREF